MAASCTGAWRWSRDDRRPRGGVTDAETPRRRFPCDDLVDSPALELWRGVAVQAPAAAVWPWLRQLRVAPYSYDWLDKAGGRSREELCDLPAPRPGDPFSTAAGRFDVGRSWRPSPAAT